MSSKMKIYKLKDFIRKSESGILDYDRVKEILRELALAASYHTNHNILVDFRETTPSSDSISDIMKIALEVEAYGAVFNNKIAAVVPNDNYRFSVAKKMEACLQVKNIQFKIFIDLENAIEWFSETTNLDFQSD